MGVFQRIKSRQPSDNEEIRYDLAVTRVSGYDYVGIALAGTLTNANSWSIVKTTYDGSGLLQREELLLDQIWDERGTS